MNSFISWRGGKKLLRNKITELFPENYDKYIEVFGGAAWVLFHKKPSVFEVYNDIDGELVNLFKCVKYHTPELKRQLSFILNSRQTFSEYKNTLEIDGFTDIQRASLFFILLKTSYGAGVRQYGRKALNINNAVEFLEEVQKRLASTVIENRNYKELIKYYDGEKTMFYIDPPYWGAENVYRFKFTDKDHLNLFEMLKNIKGKFLLSYNDCDYIRKLYKDFIIVEAQRQNNLNSKTNKNTTYFELLIRNYDC